MKKSHTALPYVLWSIAFTVIPLMLIFFFAFTTKSGGFTLANIEKIGKYTPVLIKTLNLGAIATLICFIIGYPLAYLISRASEKHQKILLMLVMLPMWMNFLLRTYGWMTLLENEGILNKIFGIIGLGPFNMIDNQGAVVLVMVYNYLPFMILPLCSIMVKIDKSVIEAAQDLGANSFNILLKVLLPLSVPGIVSGLIMVFVPSISTFIISRMVGGGNNKLIGDIIEAQIFGNTYNPYVACAISLVLMIVMLLIMAVLNSLDDEDVEGMLV
ncbi:MAG: ABC transporter permease [Oscillospiraceae bacterium]